MDGGDVGPRFWQTPGTLDSRNAGGLLNNGHSKKLLFPAPIIKEKSLILKNKYYGIKRRFPGSRQPCVALRSPVQSSAALRSPVQPCAALCSGMQACAALRGPVRPYTLRKI